MDAVLELEIGPADQAGTYVVRVLRSVGAGEPHATFALDTVALLGQRSQLEDSVLASSVGARRVLSAAETSVRAVGSQLFGAVFAGSIGAAYRTSLAVAAERGSGVQLRLRLTSPELSPLPWEALYDSETRTYLCRQEPLVRAVAESPGAGALALEPPLRVLVMVASPRGLEALDVEAERERLETALHAQIVAGRVRLEWVMDAGWDAVHAKLLEQPWHVLHFIGHGSYDPVTDEGVLAFVKEDGRADLVNASSLADLLREAEPTPRLVVLNACKSGASGSDDPFSGTAAALVRSGIHAVAAMQYAITDKAAIAFSKAFYLALAQGRTVDAAMRSGRIGILGTARSTLEWVTPVLYVRGDDTRIFDVAPLPTGDVEQQADAAPDDVPAEAHEVVPAEAHEVVPELPGPDVGSGGAPPPVDEAPAGPEQRGAGKGPGDGPGTGPGTGPGPEPTPKPVPWPLPRKVGVVAAGLAAVALAVTVPLLTRDAPPASGPPSTSRGETSQGGTSTPVSETTKLAVPGYLPWTNTGVTCAAGVSLHITTTGMITHNSSPDSTVGPDGLTDPSFRKYNVPGVPDVNTVALIGNLGNKQPYFLVGSDLTYDCPGDGTLYLGINDANLQSNGGEFATTIVRTQG